MDSYAKIEVTFNQASNQIYITSHINPLCFRDNCALKEGQLAEKGREVVNLKEELARKEKEKEELEERTSLEIKEKEKRIAEYESDISDKRQTIERLTSDKNGLLNEVDSLSKALSEQG